MYCMHQSDFGSVILPNQVIITIVLHHIITFSCEKSSDEMKSPSRMSGDKSGFFGETEGEREVES